MLTRARTCLPQENLADLQAQTARGHGSSFIKRGRGHTQQPSDRLLAWLLRARSAASAQSSAADAAYSSPSVGRDLLHVTWCVLQALRSNGRWPTAAQRDGVCEAMPSMLHDYVAEMCPDHGPDRIVVSNAVDGGITPIATCPPPPNRDNYWCHKCRGEGHANLWWVDLEGRINDSEHGGQGSTCDVTQMRKGPVFENMLRYYRQIQNDGVRDVTLTDGLVVSIGGGFDKHLLLPPRQGPNWVQSRDQPRYKVCECNL